LLYFPGNNPFNPRYTGVKIAGLTILSLGWFARLQHFNQFLTRADVNENCWYCFSDPALVGATRSAVI